MTAHVTNPAVVHFFACRTELNEYLRSRRIYWEPSRKVASTFEGKAVGLVTPWGYQGREFVFVEITAGQMESVR